MIFTEPILEVLDDAELTAVSVHELAHLDESWPVKVSRAYVPFLLIGMAALFPLMGSFGLIVALVAPALMCAGIVVSQRVARNMEIRSDRHAHAHEGDAGTYARALEKIHEANLIPAVLKGKKSVHPHLYDRMIAAGILPDYDRPAAPKTSWLASLPTLLLVFAVVLAYFLNESLHFLPSVDLAPDHAGDLVTAKLAHPARNWPIRTSGPAGARQATLNRAGPRWSVASHTRQRPRRCPRRPCRPRGG